MKTFKTKTEIIAEKKIPGLQKKSDKSGIAYGILKQVYNRGVAAWRTGHRPGTNPQQWGMARVNSFITKGKGTWGGADKDLAKKARGKKESTELTACNALYDHKIEEAEYKGKKVKLNDPIRTSENPNKKFKVYVKNDKGKVVVVRFGDPNMSIKRDDPERRKNFRARHNCDNPGPKTKARYWSCYQWRAGAKVDN